MEIGSNNIEQIPHKSACKFDLIIVQCQRQLRNNGTSLSYHFQSSLFNVMMP